MQQQSTIRVSSELLNTLKKFKEENESYEAVIWDFIEPHLELSTTAKEEIKKSVKEYKRGEFFTLEQMKKEFGF
jgi:predicted CopG family antitoxin